MKDNRKSEFLWPQASLRQRPIYGSGCYPEVNITCFDPKHDASMPESLQQGYRRADTYPDYPR